MWSDTDKSIENIYPSQIKFNNKGIAGTRISYTTEWFMTGTPQVLSDACFDNMILLKNNFLDNISNNNKISSGGSKTVFRFKNDPTKAISIEINTNEVVAVKKTLRLKEIEISKEMGVAGIAPEIHDAFCMNLNKIGRNLLDLTNKLTRLKNLDLGEKAKTFIDQTAEGRDPLQKVFICVIVMDAMDSAESDIVIF